MTTDKFQEAISLIKSGDRQNGQRLLSEVLQTDPGNELAWLWMSSLVTGDKKRYCLEKALSINPNNPQARQYLEKLKSSELPQPDPVRQAEVVNKAGMPGVHEQPKPRWLGLIVGSVGILSCICLGFYMIYTSPTGNLRTLIPVSINTELPPGTPATSTSPLVLSNPQIIDPPSNSSCTWMKNIEGKWESDLYDSIFTFHPNGVFVEEEKDLVEAGIDIPAPGNYECTSEGYLRMHRDGQDIFSYSLQVNIEGNKMIWDFIDSPLNFSIPYYRK